MSTGMVICSKCKREVHQDGPSETITTPFATYKRGTWLHCEDKTPRCEGASSKYPDNKEEIRGKYCGCDGYPF